MKYDVTVIGGGPGGYVAAIRLAKLGLKTALIEKDTLGGTCLNRGCIPTKALLHSAKDHAIISKAAGSSDPDFAAMAKSKDMIVRRLTGGVAFLEKAYGVEVINGNGVLKDAKHVQIGDDVIETEKIILAMGSEPAVPPIPGADKEKVLTSDDVLAMKELPESIVIAGGGVIGLEFAAMFSGLGVKVTIVEMLPELLPGIDREIVKVIQTRLKRKGCEIFTGARITSIDEVENKAKVVFENTEGVQQSLIADYCAMCTGRKPVTKGLGLEEAGIELDRRGYVSVDEMLQTSVQGIYAIGDITGRIQLAHVATEQGIKAALNCAGGASKMDYSAIPACIYCEPELAYVGENPDSLKEKGIDFITGEFRAMANGRAMTLQETDGMVKIYAERGTGKVLGCQILAPSASEMITEITTVLHFGGTLDDMYEIVHPHPSLSEMIIEAALDAKGLSANAAPKQ